MLLTNCFHNFQWEWKLLVILLLCGTYEKWEAPPNVTSSDNSGQDLLHAALEWQFYKLFPVSVVGKCRCAQKTFDSAF